MAPQIHSNIETSNTEAQLAHDSNSSSHRYGKQADGLCAEMQTALENVHTLHGEFRAAARISLDKAIEIGRILHSLKKQFLHGEWGAFVQAKLPFAETTATSYMRCFNNQPMLK